MWKQLWNWIMGRSWKSSDMRNRASLDFLEETIGRNVDFNGASGELSEQDEEHVIGTWRSVPCQRMAENLAELFSIIG